jgi:hypothetical protein
MRRGAPERYLLISRTPPRARPRIGQARRECAVRRLATAGIRTRTHSHRVPRGPGRQARLVREGRQVEGARIGRMGLVNAAFEEPPSGRPGTPGGPRPRARERGDRVVSPGRSTLRTGSPPPEPRAGDGGTDDNGDEWRTVVANQQYRSKQDGGDEAAHHEASYVPRRHRPQKGVLKLGRCARLRFRTRSSRRSCCTYARSSRVVAYSRA